MFLILSALSAAKTPMVGTKRFGEKVSENPYSIVLFTTRGCTECDKILDTMDTIIDRFQGKVGMLSVDVDVSKAIQKQYNVKDIPSVAIFAGSKFLRFYKGEYTTDAFINFCESLSVGSMTTLHSVFDVFEFQNNGYPANIIITNPSLIQAAKNVMPLFPGSLKFAILENKTAADQLGIENAQLTRPMDFFKVNISNIDADELLKLSKPMIELVMNAETLGNPDTPHTLIAILDERDPLQKHDIAKLWANISHLYQGNLSYQFCDYYKCNAISQSLGVVNFGNPLFVLSSRTGIRAKIQLFQNPEPTQKDLEIFLNKNVLDIDEPEYRDMDGIARLRARDFMRVVLDQRRDVILFMAAPSMQKYKECKETAKMLVELFQNLKGIEVYEFNPKTELVPGLQMPKTDKPMFSIWPASPNPSGANIPGTSPLPFIVDEIIKQVKNKIDPTYFKQIGERIQQYMDSHQ